MLHDFKWFYFISKRGKKRPIYSARIAIYDNLSTPPKIQDLESPDLAQFLKDLAETTYSLHQKSGGNLPFAVVKEVTENVIHANCQGVVVSIFPNGTGIQVSDQGPGISDKIRALQPGFTTSTAQMRQYIKGVGSGLTTVSRLMQSIGGRLHIEDNLDRGTIVQLSLPEAAATSHLSSSSKNLGGADFSRGESYKDNIRLKEVLQDLSQRQKAILAVLLEKGALGPSKIAEYVGTSPSSAYRDLVALTDQGLVVMAESGKRKLNPALDALINRDKLKLLGEN